MFSSTGTNTAKGRAAVLHRLAINWTSDPGNGETWQLLKSSYILDTSSLITWKGSKQAGKYTLPLSTIVDTQTQMECMYPSQGHTILFSWERTCVYCKAETMGVEHGHRSYGDWWTLKVNGKWNALLSPVWNRRKVPDIQTPRNSTHMRQPFGDLGWVHLILAERFPWGFASI